MTEKIKSVRCGATLDKKMAGRRYVEEHRSCQRLTTDPSGRCPSHRHPRTIIR